MVSVSLAANIGIGRDIEIFGLCIDQGARGETIEFSMDGCSVKFILPELIVDDISEEVRDDHREQGYVHSIFPDPLATGGRRLQFSVKKARLLATSRELTHALDERISASKSEKLDFFGIHDVHKKLVHSAEKAKRTLNAAFRWHLKWWLPIFDPISMDSPQNYYDYFDAKTGRRLAGAVLKVPGVYHGEGVSKELLKKIQMDLVKNIHPPIWFRYYCEAWQANACYDNRSALIFGVVAVEAFLSTTLSDYVRGRLLDSPRVASLIDSVKLGDLLKEFRKLEAFSTINIGDSALASIGTSVELRNRLMHGKSVEVNSEATVSFLQALKDLVSNSLYSGDNN